jgi:hypothetical protein
MTSLPWNLSDAEVYFLYWFIQGSIMNPETRRRLRDAWGFCERHTCGYVAVEAAYRNGWPHGAALLYEDLMERAVRAFSLVGAWRLPRLRWRLCERGPCLMCELGLGPATPTVYAPAETVARGRRLQPLQAFANSLRTLWEPYVCGPCTGRMSAPRCRRHLRADWGPIDLVTQRRIVTHIAEHVRSYARSFRFECRGTETDADRAGFIGAVGWCSGWRTWLTLIEGKLDDSDI